MSDFYLSKNDVFTVTNRISEATKISDLVSSSRVSKKQFHICYEEIVYDSMMPRIDEILSVEGTKLASLPTIGSYISAGVYVNSENEVSWYDSNQEPAEWSYKSSYNQWNKSYPFDDKYKNLIRQKVRPFSYKSLDQKGRIKSVNGIAFEIPWQPETGSIGGIKQLTGKRRILLDKILNVVTDEIASDDLWVLENENNVGIPVIPNQFNDWEPAKLEYNPPPDWDWNFQSDPGGSNSIFKSIFPFYKNQDILPPTPNETYKYFFGFGDSLEFQKITKLVGGVTLTLTQSYVNCPTFRNVVTDTFLSGNFTYHSGTTQSSSGLDLVAGVNIRGWKYGIFDANPRNLSCVFRKNRFGQFRDLLEQRIFTTLYNTDSETIIPGPVEINFLKKTTTELPLIPIGSYIPVQPELTDTYNKDKFHRENRPYKETTENFYINEVR